MNVYTVAQVAAHYHARGKVEECHSGYKYTQDQPRRGASLGFADGTASRIPVAVALPAWPLMLFSILLFPEWRNWQTQQTQNLPGITPRVGSTPSSGTNFSQCFSGYFAS